MKDIIIRVALFTASALAVASFFTGCGHNTVAQGFYVGSPYLMCGYGTVAVVRENTLIEADCASDSGYRVGLRIKVDSQVNGYTVELKEAELK